MTQTRRIDLTKEPNPEEFKIFAEYLKKETNLFAGEKYGIAHSVTFSNDVFCRPCSSEKNKGQYRYEIIGKKTLGKGAFGKVFESIATIVPLQDGSYQYKVKPPQKKRVAKIQHHQGLFDKRWGYNNVLREYHLLKQAGYHVKEPVKIQRPERLAGSSVLVMRLLGMRNFSVVRDADACNQIVLTTEERLIYTLAILRAVKDYVIDKNLVHRDLKPSNMRVDNAYHVSLVDFAAAKFLEEKVPENIGTPEYASPEAVSNLVTDARADIYSLSLILAQVWGAKGIEFDEKEPRVTRRIQEKHEQYAFEDLFCRTQDLSDDHQQKIRTILTFMHKTDKSLRPSISDVITLFANIQAEREVLANKNEITEVSAAIDRVRIK